MFTSYRGNPSRLSAEGAANPYADDLVTHGLRPLVEIEALGRLDAAEALVDVGCSVFPLREGSSRPVFETGAGDASRDPAALERWWGPGGHPDANVAAVLVELFHVVVVTGEEGLNSLGHLVERPTFPVPCIARVDVGDVAQFWIPGSRHTDLVGRIDVAPGVEYLGTGAWIPAPYSRIGGVTLRWAEPYGWPPGFSALFWKPVVALAAARQGALMTSTEGEV